MVTAETTRCLPTQKSGGTYCVTRCDGLIRQSAFAALNGHPTLLLEAFTEPERRCFWPSRAAQPRAPRPQPTE
jgi:hypothetical protein